MTHQDVELLAVGAGPANLALAVALEELTPQIAADSLIVERGPSVVWQPGMLLPEALSQVSFVKDLVTLRNPRSAFSFMNYLHSVGRLNDFVNLGSFLPYRRELSSYFAWVAEALSRVRIEYGRECVEVVPRHRGEDLAGWLVRLRDGDTIGCRYLVMGSGRDPHVPDAFADLPRERVVHSTEYVTRIGQVQQPKARVAVVGGAQSAAEMFEAVQNDLPDCRPTLIMRSIGLVTYESSKFTNELFYPSYVDTFHQAVPEARAEILAQMHRTNYAGVAPGTLESLYRRAYLDRLAGADRLEILTLQDIVAAHLRDDEVVLHLRDRRSGATRELPTDLVLLGTGFERRMPRLVQDLARRLGLDQIEVTRHYRMLTGGDAEGACYLQGVNEATHGIADSLLSVLAVRAQEIVLDVEAHRQGAAALDPGLDPGLAPGLDAAAHATSGPDAGPLAADRATVTVP